MAFFKRAHFHPPDLSTGFEAQHLGHPDELHGIYIRSLDGKPFGHFGRVVGPDESANGNLIKGNHVLRLLGAAQPGREEEPSPTGTP